MNRTAVVFSSLLLISAPLGTFIFISNSTAVPSSPSVGDTTTDAGSNISYPGTANALQLTSEEIEVERVEQITLSGSVTFSREVSTLRANYSWYSLQEQLQQANTTSEEQSIIRKNAAYIQRHTTELSETARQARLDYSRGEISTHEYLRILGEIEAKATALDKFSTQLRESIQNSDVNTESIVRAQSDLRRFQGPVRNQIFEAFAGQRDPVTVYIAAGPNGVVLSTMDGQQYVREAYYSPNRDEVGEYTVPSLVEASERVSEIYPWVWNHTDQIQADPSGPTGVYKFTLSHLHGNLTTHLDRRTAEVFYEVQYLNGDRLPMNTKTKQVDDLEMTVEHLYVGGPAKVTVFDAASLSPVNSSVRVNGRLVGATGSNGELWVLLPRESTIATTRGSSNISISVSS